VQIKKIVVVVLVTQSKISNSECFMKYKLTTEDLEDIAEVANSNPTLYWIADLKSKKFNVGDVLISSDVFLEPPVTFGSANVLVKDPNLYENSNVRVRHIVIHVDPINDATWIKDIEVDGNVDQHSIRCLSQCVNHDYFVSYEVDPLSVEMMLLGEEYDIKSLLLEEDRRIKAAFKANKKNGTLVKSLKQANEIIAALKVGDIFYVKSQNNLNTDIFQEYILQSKRKYNMDYAKNNSIVYAILTRLERTGGSINDDCVYYAKVDHKNQDGYPMSSHCDLKSVALVNKYIYLNKPVLLKPKSEV